MREITKAVLDVVKVRNELTSGFPADGNAQAMAMESEMLYQASIAVPVGYREQLVLAAAMLVTKIELVDSIRAKTVVDGQKAA